MEEEQLISLKEASARFGISQSQLQILARKGRVRAVKVGNSWVTAAAAVADGGKVGYAFLPGRNGAVGPVRLSPFVPTRPIEP